MMTEEEAIEKAKELLEWCDARKSCDGCPFNPPEDDPEMPLDCMGMALEYVKKRLKGHHEKS